MNKTNYKKVLDTIEANPACWRQDAWHCDSSHCFAGWAQILSGKRADSYTTRRDARIFLDLSAVDADYFFAAHRTLEDFRAGYDRDGYDCYGYRDGYDCYGYNRFGYNPDGYNRAGYDRFGYDLDGYDLDGLDLDGLDRNNTPKAI
jgi:hypothetical protein